MPRARVNGVELQHEETGQGQPLLFIHGGYGGAGTSVVPQLRQAIVDFMPADRVRTITYDRRCAGLSEYTLDHYTNIDLAEDAIALLDHLEVPRAIVVGSSAAGPIALQLVLAHPERVSALCLTNTGSYLMREGRPRSKIFRELVERAQTEGDRAVFDARREVLRTPAAPIGRNAENEAFMRRQEAVREALVQISDDELFRLSTGELRNLEAAFDLDHAERLAEVRVPTIVIHGTADGTVPFAWGEDLHRGIAGSEFHAIEGADHGVLNYPEAAATLSEWVNRQFAVTAEGLDRASMAHE